METSRATSYSSRAMGSPCFQMGVRTLPSGWMVSPGQSRLVSEKLNRPGNVPLRTLKPNLPAASSATRSMVL